MEATGVQAVGETDAALAYVKGRRGLSPRLKFLVLLICMLVVGLPMAAWGANSWVVGALSVEFVLFGMVVGSVLIHVLAGTTLRQALAKRGQAYEAEVTFRLTPDDLVCDMGEVKVIARWSCVTDLYRTRKHWVFLFQSRVMVLPRRFFPTPEGERAFIAAALSRMTEAARARSPDAIGFIEA